jgi:hypothetical protein
MSDESKDAEAESKEVVSALTLNDADWQVLKAKTLKESRANKSKPKIVPIKGNCLEMTTEEFRAEVKRVTGCNMWGGY